MDVRLYFIIHSDIVTTVLCVCIFLLNSKGNDGNPKWKKERKKQKDGSFWFSTRHTCEWQVYIPLSHVGYIPVNMSKSLYVAKRKKKNERKQRPTTIFAVYSHWIEFQTVRFVAYTTLATQCIKWHLHLFYAMATQHFFFIISNLYVCKLNKTLNKCVMCNGLKEWERRSEKRGDALASNGGNDPIHASK